MTQTSTANAFCSVDEVCETGIAVAEPFINNRPRLPDRRISRKAKATDGAITFVASLYPSGSNSNSGSARLRIPLAVIPAERQTARPSAADAHTSPPLDVST